tara:strand:- start:1357 stop:2049 length:693 start_codon:yes stop_codon:yes gene_type:complete
MDSNKVYNNDLTCFSFSCSSFKNAERLKHSNKVLLPESVLYELQKDDNLSFPIFFKIVNKKNDYGHVCGIEEFTAPPGVCHVPYHVMADLGIKEGCTVNIQLFRPVNGTFVKLRFHTSSFSKLNDTKSVLEKCISKDYPVVTKGQMIVLQYEEKTYNIDIVDTKPDDVIQIINTNLNVDFDKTLDYVEVPVVEVPVVPLGMVRSVNLKKFSKHSNGLVPFSGKGNRLGEN